jgi:hypothetical protein
MLVLNINCKINISHNLEGWLMCLIIKIMIYVKRHREG